MMIGSDTTLDDVLALITPVKEAAMSNPIMLSRKALYSEIWEISAAGVAKKYGLTYADLLKCCKEHDIPVPPSGYWTKLAFNQVLSKEELPNPDRDEMLEFLPGSPAKKQKVTIHEEKTTVYGIDEEKEIKKIEAVLGKATTQDSYGGKRNVYQRDVLYQEIWSMPVSKVALKYGVSDVALHKICKSLNVPAPPRGYWARLQSGQKIEKTPLPAAENCDSIVGVRSQGKPTKPYTIHTPRTLAFLDENERERVIHAAEALVAFGKGTHVDPKFSSYQKKVIEWNKTDKRDLGAEKNPQRYRLHRNPPPFLAGVISEESLPRIFRIMESLYRAMKPFGCRLTDDLCFIIRDERVALQVYEAQDVVPHVVTKNENLQLLEYEDKRNGKFWNPKPNIRKHDYIFNGLLHFSVNGKSFADSDTQNVEEQLGNIMIELFESSEVVRRQRLAAEEKKRREQAEKIRREEIIRQRNQEIKRTKMLVNEADDFQIACSIRAYADAVANSTNANSDEMMEWLRWARAKADWFDPTINADDPLMGKRDHGSDVAQKELREGWYY